MFERIAVILVIAGSSMGDTPPSAPRFGESAREIRPEALPGRPVEAAAVPVELGLGEIYRTPVGPRGLEYSERALSLRERAVRLTGYLVRQSAPTPYALLLAPRPVRLHEREYGLADDLAPNVVHVSFPRGPMPLLPWVPDRMSVDGILELGPREEPDGRISHVRLRAFRPFPDRVPDPVSPVTPKKPEPVEKSRLPKT